MDGVLGKKQLAAIYHCVSLEVQCEDLESGSLYNKAGIPAVGGLYHVAEPDARSENLTRCPLQNCPSLSAASPRDP